MQQHVQRQQAQNAVLQVRVLVHVDRDHADVRQEAPGPAHDVLLGEPQLAGRVQAPVVHRVVVALGQELDRAVGLFVQLDDPVDDRNVAALDLEHDDLADAHRFLLVRQKQQVTTVAKGGGREMVTF